MSCTPQEFEANVDRMVPFRSEAMGAAVDAALSRVKGGIWLDVGCGTGSFYRDRLSKVPGFRFVLSDPSSDMLACARSNIHLNSGVVFEDLPTDLLGFPDSSVDVITAMYSHHYCEVRSRVRTLENCFRMLAPGGVYISVEHRGYDCFCGSEDAEERWRAHHAEHGVPKEESDVFFSRFGIEVHPLSEVRHIRMLRDAGFEDVEMFFGTYATVGVVGRKPLRSEVEPFAVFGAQLPEPAVQPTRGGGLNGEVHEAVVVEAVSLRIEELVMLH